MVRDALGRGGEGDRVNDTQAGPWLRLFARAQTRRATIAALLGAFALGRGVSFVSAAESGTGGDAGGGGETGGGDAGESAGSTAGGGAGGGTGGSATAGGTESSSGGGRRKRRKRGRHRRR
jgi:hypothetical protein